MRIVILYLSSLVIFLGVDAIALSYFIAPIFQDAIGHLMAQPFRVVPALGFYLGYVTAILYLASIPALRVGRALAALFPGVVLGLAAYGTYEFTNYAILDAWQPHLVVLDTIWGGLLTGITAWGGTAITLRVFPDKGD